MPYRLIVYLAALGAVIGFCWMLHNHGYNKGKNEVQLQWEMAKVDQLVLAGAANDKARQKEQELSKTVGDLQKELTNEKNRNAAVVADLRERLRSRPERPTYSLGSGLSASAGLEPAPRGCTGAELYRSDSEFLVRLAERADEVRASLAECRAAYSKAQQALSK